MGEDNPLEFITTEELIAELRKRTECMLLVFTAANKVGPDEMAEIYYRGGLFTGIGLAAFAHQELLADVAKEDEPDDYDEIDEF